MEENVRRILEDHEKRIRKLEQMVMRCSHPDNLQETITIKEFMKTLNFDNDVDRTLAIGYYLEKYMNFQSFNVKDIEDGFVAAREPVPKNINSKIFKNVRKDFLMPLNKKKDNLKTWTITNKGEQYIERSLKQGR